MNKPQNNSHCLGVVLAGGMSSRMGQDKALLLHQQQTMLAFSQQVLHDAGIEDVVISGQQHGLADQIQHLGPMGGIYSVYQQYKPQAMLVIPVDLPLLTSEIIQELKLAGQLSNKACYYQDNFLPLYLPINALVRQYFQQQFARLGVEAKLAIEAQLSAKTHSAKHNKTTKGPSIGSLTRAIPSQVLKLSNKNGLFNANTPTQWQQAQTQFTQLRNSHGEYFS